MEEERILAFQLRKRLYSTQYRKNNLGLDRFVNFEDGVNLSAEPALAANETADPGAGLSTAPTHSFLPPTHPATHPEDLGGNPSPALSVQEGVRGSPRSAARDTPSAGAGDH